MTFNISLQIHIYIYMPVSFLIYYQWQHFLAPCQKYDCYNGGNCEYLPNWPPEYAQCICPDEFVGPHCKLGKHHQLMLIYRLLLQEIGHNS